MEHDTQNSFSNPVSAVLETTSGCIDSGPSPTPNPTPNPTPGPTSPPTTGQPTNAPTPGPTSLPTTSSPTKFVAKEAKYVCAKIQPLPETICAEGSTASGECTAVGDESISCGKGGKMCWWNDCPAGPAPGPTPPAPTPPAPTPPPPPPSNCSPAGVSCSDASVNCCNVCSGGRPASRVCL